MSNWLMAPSGQIEQLTHELMSNWTLVAQTKWKVTDRCANIAQASTSMTFYTTDGHRRMVAPHGHNYATTHHALCWQ